MEFKKIERETKTHEIDDELDFGQYKGRTIRYVVEEYDQAQYILWAANTISWFDLSVEAEEFCAEHLHSEDEDPYGIKEVWMLDTVGDL